MPVTGRCRASGTFCSSAAQSPACAPRARHTDRAHHHAGDGRCPICDSYVRPATLVRICDECNYGSYEGRCVICGGVGISDAYYCKECTLQEKDVRCLCLLHAAAGLPGLLAMEAVVVQSVDARPAARTVADSDQGRHFHCAVCLLLVDEAPTGTPLHILPAVGMGTCITDSAFCAAARRMSEDY
jgi:PHF5-like protein